MLSEELVDIATRHQVYLERLKAGEIKRTDVLFRRLNDDLVRILNALPTTELGVLTLIQRAKLLEAIRTNQQEAYQEHLKRMAATYSELATFSREFELESLDEVTEDEVEPDDGDAAAGLWAAVQSRPMSATGKLLAAWLGAWMLNEVTRGTDLTRRAIAEGWSASRLITAFRGTAAGRYEDGLFASSRRNTRATINTAVQHVSSAARAHTMENTEFQPRGTSARVKTDAEGRVTSIPRAARAAAARAGIKVGDKIRLMGYRWISILDDATTQICRSLDGQVFAFGKGPLPPAHVNCRSSIIAEILGRWLKRTPTGRFAPRPVRTAQGAKGAETVKGGTTYYEWLKTQPEAFQNDALGLTRATLFRKGGLSAEAFAKLNLGRNFQPLTLDEMRRLKPNAFRRAGL